MKTFDQLYDVSGEEFRRADLLMAGTIEKLYTGELGLFLVNLTQECKKLTDCTKKAFRIRGRQLMHRALGWKRVNEKRNYVYTLQDMMALKPDPERHSVKDPTVFIER